MQMPYVRRNADGAVVSVSKDSREDHEEFVSNNDSGLLDFFSDNLAEDNPLYYLIKSDLDLTRVLEDLIDLMVNKGMINFTDLPDSAQQKLMGRRKARAQLREGQRRSVLVEDDDILRL
jgi:hypothetical protein